MRLVARMDILLSEVNDGFGNDKLGDSRAAERSRLDGRKLSVLRVLERDGDKGRDFCKGISSDRHHTGGNFHRCKSRFGEHALIFRRYIA